MAARACGDVLSLSVEWIGIGFDLHWNNQELGPNVDRLLILGFVAWASLLFAEGGLGNRERLRTELGVWTR